MTAAEATTIRTALMEQYLAWIRAGCPMAYSINGRGKTNVSHEFWTAELAKMDAIIDRASGTGGCRVAKFRRPD